LERLPHPVIPVQLDWFDAMDEDVSSGHSKLDELAVQLPRELVIVAADVVRVILHRDGGKRSRAHFAFALHKKKRSTTQILCLHWLHVSPTSWDKNRMRDSR
jgi:hypothetical protein